MLVNLTICQRFAPVPKEEIALVPLMETLSEVAVLKSVVADDAMLNSAESSPNRVKHLDKPLVAISVKMPFQVADAIVCPAVAVVAPAKLVNTPPEKAKLSSPKYLHLLSYVRPMCS